jgi:hypothetical protein
VALVLELELEVEVEVEVLEVQEEVLVVHHQPSSKALQLLSKLSSFQ